MKDDRKNKNRHVKRGRNYIPALCSVIGSLILAAVILSALPLALPRLFGYSAYCVVSGSMEPALPVGSVVYVQPTAFSEIHGGDIIAFRDGDTVVTHRVIECRPQEGVFITKGDANETTDIMPTPYRMLIGRVKLCVPMLGRLTSLYSAREGKLTVILFAVSGLLFCMIGSRLREHAARKSAQGFAAPGQEEEKNT